MKSNRLTSHILIVSLIISLTAVVLFTACQSPILEPKRPDQGLTNSDAYLPPTAETLVLPAPTATGTVTTSLAPEGFAAESRPSPVTLWIGEGSDRQASSIAEMTDEFEEDSGITVDVVMIPSRLLPQLVQTAEISGTLPDIILHPYEYSAGWVDEGILDSQAASAVIEELGVDSFDQGALRLLANKNSSGYSAIPSDGWQQLLIYRADWFDNLGLAPPESFGSLLLAAESIFQPEENISGIVVPTDSDLASTQWAFEHLALANGCQLIDELGEVQLLHPACLDTLDYYRLLVNQYSPIGVQTETSALNAYLEGRTGIIIATPAVLPALFGLDAQALPRCPACESALYLAENSGFVTRIEGRGDFAGPANFTEINSLGITTAAEREAAEQFALFWFGAGYRHWLSVDSIQKVPMRFDSDLEPGVYLDAWRAQPVQEDGPALEEFYGAEKVRLLAEDITASPRWGISTGNSVLITDVYEELTFAPLLQEMLSGYFTSSQTIIQMQQAAINLIPGYRFRDDSPAS